jgi:hypothetical protein
MRKDKDSIHNFACEEATWEKVLGSPRRNREVNIQMDLKDLGLEDGSL